MTISASPSLFLSLSPAVATDAVFMASWLLAERLPSGYALLLAARMGRGDLMIHMLNMGASATASFRGLTLRHPSTPLQMAVTHAAQNNGSMLDAVAYLWRRKEVRLCVEEATYALGIAIRLMHVDIVRLLLTPPTPLDVNVPDRPSNGVLPLHVAASVPSSQSEAMLHVLLEHGASCTARDSLDRCALHRVLSGRDGDEIRANHVRILLAACPASCDSVNTFLETPLHCAARHNLIACARVLLSHPGSQALTMRNTKEMTPYELAGLKEYAELQAILAEAQTARNFNPLFSSA